VSNSARDAVLAIAASSGNGATYADRLACGGYDLVQIARSKDQLETNASRLRSEPGMPVAVVHDDPTVIKDLARLETRQPQDWASACLPTMRALWFPLASPIALPSVFAHVRKQPMPWRIQ